MIDQSILDSITKFGQEITNPKEDAIINEPLLDFTPEQFLSLLDFIKGEKDSPLEVGIDNLLPHLISSIWTNLNDDQKELTRQKIHGKLNFDFYEKSISRFSDACIAIYKLSTYKWDELINFIFNDKISEITGFLFIRLISSADSSFIKEHIKKILDLMVKLFPISSCSVQTGLIVMLSIVDTANAFKDHPELVSLLWTSLIRIFTEEPDRIDFILPLVGDIFEASPEILNEKTELVTKTISSISDEKSAKPILHLIPYLNTDDLSILLEKLFSIADQFITENNEIPKDLISDIDESPLDDLTESSITKIIEFLKPKLSTAAGLSLFAPFAAHISEKFGEKELFDVVDNCINDSPIKIALGLAIFECLSGYSEDLPFELPDNLMYKFLELFVNDEEFVRNAAYSTISSLIENNIFIHADQTAALLKIFPKISSRPDNKPELILFFKQLRKLLRVEGVSEDVVTSLFDFSISIIKSKSANKTESDFFLLSQCLSIICTIDTQDGEDHPAMSELPLLLPLSITMLKSNVVESFVYSSRTLVLLTSLSPKDSRRPVLAVVPRVIQIATGEFETPPKVKGNVAVALASILICLEVKKDFERCLKIIDDFLASKEVHLITAAGTMSEILRSSRDEQLNIAIFDVLSTSAMSTKDTVCLNSLLNAVRKIIKNFKVPEEKVVPLLNLIISGGHPVFERKPPSMFTDKSTKMFSYLTEICDHYEDLKTEITPIAVAWFRDAPLFMRGTMMQLITYLVTEGAVKGDSEEAAILMQILTRELNGQKPETDEILLGNILALLKANKDLYDTKRLMAQVHQYWDAVKDTEDDQKLAWKAQIASSILVLCSLGCDAEKELVEQALACYTSSDEFGNCEEMSEAIVKMCDDTENKWNDLKPTIAKTITEVMIQPKEKLNEYAIPQNIFTELKRVLKLIIRANSQVEREITKGFGKNRQLQNRFKALFK